MKQKEYDSVKGKILKLYALAEKGVGGEAENARRMLEQQLRRYGLSLEAILAEENGTRWYEIRGAWQKCHLTLLTHCYAKVTNRGTMTYKHRGRRLWLELTPYQYAEISSMFDWHKKRFERELDKLKDDAMSAFIVKHNLFSETNSDDCTDPMPLSAKEKRRLLRILGMMEGMDDVTYSKLLAEATDEES